jgi:hypothetical protein|tara:strand:+ start:99 stop:242 length:144 start_codon:yes stop_codon:yes gene_type:complete
MNNLIASVAGAVLGIVIWKFQGSEFGIGPFLFILIMAWGGAYTWGKL